MARNDDRQGILLESGTNEVEIIEFYLGGQSFGINVAKVKQIVQFENSLLTKIPDTHKAVLGTFLFRETTIPLIDFNEALSREREEGEESSRPLVLITEFNQVINGFKIDGVNRIHRISWEDLQPMSQLFTGQKSSFTGSVSIDKREILIVDVEQLLAEFNPEASFTGSEEAIIETEQKKTIADLRVVFAEDSNFIRQSVVDKMHEVGFKHVRAFENGKLAHDYLADLARNVTEKEQNISDYLNIVISDIEMPQLDGLTLCKYIKDNQVLSQTPVLVFSSLINQQMAHKCESVGADAYVSKPKLSDLIQLVLKFSGTHC